MTYYNLRANAPDKLPFIIIKFDKDLNPESVYEVGFTACSCPAGHRPKCRHREMLPKLRERVDTAWFWHFETQSWADPTGEAKAHDEVAEHDAATGGLEAGQVGLDGPASFEEAMMAAGVDLNSPFNMTATEVDERIAEQAQAKPIGNEAVSGFRRRV